MTDHLRRAAEEATSRLKRRLYDPHMNQPGFAEAYLTFNVLRWPVDFSAELRRQYFPNSNFSGRMKA